MKDESKRNPMLSNNVNQYMYSFMQESNVGYDNDIAIQYMGVKITFGELNKRIDEYAKALIDLGVKPGEIVSICMPTTPETVALMYAINKIGAVSNFMDLTRDEEYLTHCINSVDSKLLITYNGILSKVGRFIDKTKLDNVVYVSPIESMPLVKRKVVEFLGQASGKMTKNPKFSEDSGFKGWDEFLKIARASKSKIITPPYVKEQLSFIEYTSGTTGIPKAIELTNDCANLKTYQYQQNGLMYDRGDVFLDIIPVFVAFGVIMGIQLPLSMGMRDELIAAYDNNKVFDYFKDLKPVHLCLTPASYSYLVNHPKFKTLDLSQARTMGCGGDALNTGQNIIVETKLREQGCMYPVTNGYGASELGAPFCTCTWDHGKAGSVGKPLPGNEVHIFKPGTFEELGPNEIGEVCMVTDYPMIGYHGNQEATDKVLIKLDNGRTAVMLGDMGYVDSEGDIFIKGRKPDLLESNIGEIWPVDIESFIQASGVVTMCAVSNNEVEGRLTVYFEPALGFDDLQDLENVIKSYVTNSAEFKGLDLEVKRVDKVPLTLTGKIDRKSLRVSPENQMKLKLK